MGGIADEQVEWAIVNRLKAMLDDPPETGFNVTQSFALFSSVLMWTKNRGWVAGNGGARGDWLDPADHRAHDFREALRVMLITEAPWSLALDMVDERGPRQINTDFEGMTAEDFFKWLRDALAHGDGRTIAPIHRMAPASRRTVLAGFRIVFVERRGSPRRLTLTLRYDDIRRIGAALADLFCKTLSGGDRYFEEEAGTAQIVEAA